MQLLRFYFNKELNQKQKSLSQLDIPSEWTLKCIDNGNGIYRYYYCNLLLLLLLFHLSFIFKKKKNSFCLVCRLIFFRSFCNLPLNVCSIAFRGYPLWRSLYSSLDRSKVLILALFPNLFIFHYLYFTNLIFFIFSLYYLEIIYGMNLMIMK